MILKRGKEVKVSLNAGKCRSNSDYIRTENRGSCRVQGKR